MNFTKDPIKQMIDFQKAAFNTAYDAIIKIQQQTENISNIFLPQATWLPEETERTINDSVKSYKKGCENFKKVVNEYFDAMEKLFPESVKEEKAKSK